MNRWVDTLKHIMPLVSFVMPKALARAREFMLLLGEQDFINKPIGQWSKLIGLGGFWNRRKVKSTESYK